MMSEQAVIAFIADLILKGGLNPEKIERSVDRVRDIKIGESITGDDPLIRAFAMEQSARLLKGK